MEGERLSRQGSEIIAGPTAIQQALFFHFRLSIREIATITGVQYHTVYGSVWKRSGNNRAYPWEVRKHKDEAIEAASEILEAWRRTKLESDLEAARRMVSDLESRLAALSANTESRTQPPA